MYTVIRRLPTTRHNSGVRSSPRTMGFIIPCRVIVCALAPGVVCSSADGCDGSEVTFCMICPCHWSRHRPFLLPQRSAPYPRAAPAVSYRRPASGGDTSAGVVGRAVGIGLEAEAQQIVVVLAAGVSGCPKPRWSIRRDHCNSVLRRPGSRPCDALAGATAYRTLVDLPGLSSDVMRAVLWKNAAAPLTRSLVNLATRCRATSRPRPPRFRMGPPDPAQVRWARACPRACRRVCVVEGMPVPAPAERSHGLRA